MLLGTVMKGANAVHFKDYLELLFEVIPQIILMLALFGFMDLMIIVKWTTDWDAWQADHPDEVAPGIISAMIVMFIKGGSKPEPDVGEMVEADLFSNQGYLMQCGLLAAAITVPMMLCVNPIIRSIVHVSYWGPDKAAMILLLATCCSQNWTFAGLDISQR